MQNADAYFTSSHLVQWSCESVTVGMECRPELLAPASGLTTVA
jgi:hypothetical protein